MSWELRRIGPILRGFPVLWDEEEYYAEGKDVKPA